MTGSAVAAVGVGGAPADDDAAGGGGVTAGDELGAGGGCVAVHWTSTTPAAIISASTATRRPKDVNWDESSPLASIPTRPLRSAVSLDKSSANATADRFPEDYWTERLRPCPTFCPHFVANQHDGVGLNET